MKSLRILLVASVFLLSSFVSPQEAFAKLWINEFSSYNSDDWVEIYNESSDSVNLGSYQLRDESSNKKNLTEYIQPREFLTFDFGISLNKAGDTIKLVSVSDENNVLDQVQYGSSGDDVAAPGEEQSAGRSSDGDSQWVIFATASKENSNNDSSVIPTITSTPTKTPTPTNSPTPKKTPTPTKAPTATKIPTPTKLGQVATKVPTSKASSKTSSTNSEETDDDTFSPSKTRKSASLSGYPTAILGASSAAKSKISTTPKTRENDVLVKEASTTSPVIWIFIGGALFLLVCGILVFLKMKRERNKGYL